jgi:hypothetical protein
MNYCEIMSMPLDWNRTYRRNLATWETTWTTGFAVARTVRETRCADAKELVQRMQQRVRVMRNFIAGRAP